MILSYIIVFCGAQSGELGAELMGVNGMLFPWLDANCLYSLSSFCSCDRLAASQSRVPVTVVGAAAFVALYVASVRFLASLPDTSC